MLAAVLLTLAATDAPGPIAVVVASKRAGAEPFAAKLATKVQQQLAADEAAGKKISNLAKACQGATDCLQKLAQSLGPHAVVVGVDVGKISKNLAIHLEAVTPGATEPLALIDFPAGADAWDPQSAEPIAAFVKQLNEKLEALKPAAPVAKNDDIKPFADVPPAASPVQPANEPAPGPVVTTSKPAPSRSRIVPITFAAAAIAAGIVSVATLILGLSEKGIVDRSLSMDGTMTELTQSDLTLHKNRGNAEFTVALSTLIVAVAFGATAGLLFATN